VADPKPLDAWQDSLAHYFVFELRPLPEGTATATAFALFKMRWEDNGPVRALLITPSGDRASAEVRDLRWPDVAPYTVALSVGGATPDITAKE